MSNIYVRLTEQDLIKIQQALAENSQLETENLICKINLLVKEMQPGTTLTLEAVSRDKNSKAS